MTVDELFDGWHPSFRQKVLIEARADAFRELQSAIGDYLAALAKYDGLNAQCVALAPTRPTEQDPTT